MSQLYINTTQNVNVEFNLASLGSRILAQLLDLVFKACYVTTVLIILNYFDFFTRISIMDYWSFAALIILFFLPVIFYSVFQEVIWNGQTLGKKIMKIRVIKIDGFNAGFADYAIRWLFRVIDVSIGYGIIGLITVIVSDKSQRFGDMAAGTGVISLKKDISINQTILLNLKEDYEPLFPTVIRLSDNDVRIINDTFQAALKAKDYKTISKLVFKIKEVTGIQDTNLKDIQFINTVMRDYNYYTQEM